MSEAIKLPATWRETAKAEIPDSDADHFSDSVKLQFLEREIAELREWLGQPDPVQPAHTEHVQAHPMAQVLTLALEALEAARNGIQWYQEMLPAHVDGSDDEADALIARAIETLTRCTSEGGAA